MFKALDTKYTIVLQMNLELGKKRILVDRTAIKSATQVITLFEALQMYLIFDRNDKALCCYKWYGWTAS